MISWGARQNYEYYYHIIFQALSIERLWQIPPTLFFHYNFYWLKVYLTSLLLVRIKLCCNRMRSYIFTSYMLQRFDKKYWDSLLFQLLKKIYIYHFFPFLTYITCQLIKLFFSIKNCMVAYMKIFVMYENKFVLERKKP